MAGGKTGSTKGSGGSRRKRAPRPTETLERADWLAAARSMLTREGFAAVKVERLAKQLGVTRGGFYWRFTGLDDLQRALIADWRERNSWAVLAALDGPGTPVERFRALTRVWIEEKDFDPAYDTAMRDWARVSKRVARAVRTVDEARIEAFHRLFLDAGYSEGEATIRARIVYFHQVGYYAMHIKQSRAERYELLDLYVPVLTGFPERSLALAAG